MSSNPDLDIRREQNREAQRRFKLRHPERVREKNRRRDLANPEKARARRIGWAKANPGRVKQIAKAWRERNGLPTSDRVRNKNETGVKWKQAYPERARELARAWWKKNQALRAFHEAKRRAITKQATPKWANQFFMREIYDLARLRTKLTGFKWHVDHIVPLRSDVVCGLHCEYNLQVIPAVANIRKNNRLLETTHGR